MVSEFAEQFVKMETENIRLKSELTVTKNLVVDEHLKNEALEQEVAKLKKDLDKEIKARESAEAALSGHEVRLHEAAEALLGEFFLVTGCRSIILLLIYHEVMLTSLLVVIVAADIPVDKSARLRVGPLEDAITFAIDSADKSKALFGKVKSTLVKLYGQIFPRAPQVTGLEAMLGSFWAQRENPIDFIKRNQRILAATMTFQLLMGHGVNADFEELTKSMPRDDDGELVDLADFKDSAKSCALQLINLVDQEKAKIQEAPTPASTPAPPSSSKSPKL